MIALDAMGGDHAPTAAVRAAVEAAAEGQRLLVVGDRQAILAELSRLGAAAAPGIELVESDGVVFADEDGARAVRAKPDSSVAVACRLVGEGRAQAAVSAGNTGAMLAAATLYMRRIPGVMRPAIALVLPGPGGRPIVLLDGGASADARPEHFLQFALMGRLLSRDVLGVPAPRVGLLSIGEEDGKGSELVQTAHELLRGSPGFIGNVEGRDIPTGTVDVVVTDGFTGNVVLKTMEGLAAFIVDEMRQAIGSTWPARIGGLLVRPALRRMRVKIDPESYGGAVLLGVRGLAVIGHGNSGPRGIANAIRMAARGLDGQVVDHFSAALAQEAAARSPAT